MAPCRPPVVQYCYKELYDDAINPFTAEIMYDPHDIVASNRGYNSCSTYLQINTHTVVEKETLGMLTMQVFGWYKDMSQAEAM